ncbi:MAG: hypothetical protein KDD56_05440 [Bdellovibrionales bacterium]|nr:hypothetical protein [Bdellovibrionales bacterium]
MSSIKDAGINPQQNISAQNARKVAAANKAALQERNISADGFEVKKVDKNINTIPKNYSDKGRLLNVVA